MIALEDHPNGIILTVKAQPGARRNGLASVHAGALKVQVTQAPEKGKASEAVLETVADALNLKRSQVSLLAGRTSPHKRLLITGLSRAELQERLRMIVRDGW